MDISDGTSADANSGECWAMHEHDCLGAKHVGSQNREILDG